MANRSDDFNRANSALNGSTPSDGGSAWTAQLGVDVVSNEAQLGASFAWTPNWLETSSTTGRLSAVVRVLGNAVLVMRYVDANNWWSVQILSNQLGVYKRVSGTFTGYGSVYNGTVSVGDTIEIEVTAGNVWTVKQNGTLRINPGTADSAHSSATKIGIAGFSGSAKFDDLVFTDTASGGSAITQASGSATASLLAGGSTAAATMAAAAGVSTASTVAGSRTAAASISASAGVSTASTLAGASVNAAAIASTSGASSASAMAGAAVSAATTSSAAGLATAATLVGVTGTGANIGLAAGSSSSATLAGSAVAASSVSSAAGLASAASIAGASTAASAIGTAPGAATAATLVGSTAGDASAIAAAAGVSSAQIIVGASFARAAMSAATGTATASTITVTGGIVILSAPPIGHGPALSRRAPQQGQARRSVLNTRTR